MSKPHKLRWTGLFLALLACVGPPPPSLEQLHDRGYEALQKGDLTTAEQLADQGMERVEAGDAEPWLPAFQVLKAEALAGRRQDREAADLLDPLLRPNASRSSTQGDAVHVRALMTHGLLQCRSGSEGALEAGLSRLELAAEQARALSSDLLQGEVDLRLGTCLFMFGRVADAKPYFENALRLAHHGAIPHLESQAAGSLGLIHIRDGKFDQATEWLHQALAVARQIGADISAAKTVSNLGWCYLELGNYERAFTLLSQGEASTRQLGLDGDRITNLNNLGRALYRLDRPAEAMDRYAQALDLAQQIGAKPAKPAIVSNMALVAFDELRLDEAETLLQESLALRLEVGDAVGRLHTLLAQAQVLSAQERDGEAEPLVRQVLESPVLRPDLEQEAHGILARLHAKSGHIAEARDELAKAFELLDQTRVGLRNVGHRMSFSSGTKELADIAVKLSVDSGQPIEALQHAMENRARLLRERLRQGAAADTAGAGRSVADLQQLAQGSDLVFLSYWTSRRRSFVWLIHADGVELRELDSERRLSEDIDRYQRMVLQSGDPRIEGLEVGRRLWDRLVAPVARWIPDGAQVVIAPDGPLHRLSFDALIVPTEPSNGPPSFWIEKVTISLTPSLALVGESFRLSPADASRASRLLLIGDPVPSTDFPRLAHASREIQRLADLFEPDRRRIITGAEAIPSAFRQAQPEAYGLIHLAAHVTANRELPLESAVVLSPGSGSHKLYARDVLDIPLQADLVTLSACRSAGARAQAGEGLVGLAWAFMSSGARNVIGGLWDVEDASTSRLMEHLYRELRAGEPAADALRRAKLSLLSSESAYRKPYYWAPFVLYHGASSL